MDNLRYRRRAEVLMGDEPFGLFGEDSHAIPPSPVLSSDEDEGDGEVSMTLLSVWLRRNAKKGKALLPMALPLAALLMLFADSIDVALLLNCLTLAFITASMVLWALTQLPIFHRLGNNDNTEESVALLPMPLSSFPRALVPALAVSVALSCVGSLIELEASLPMTSLAFYAVCAIFSQTQPRPLRLSMLVVDTIAVTSAFFTFSPFLVPLLLIRASTIVPSFLNEESSQSLALAASFLLLSLLWRLVLPAAFFPTLPSILLCCTAFLCSYFSGKYVYVAVQALHDHGRDLQRAMLRVRVRRTVEADSPNLDRSAAQTRPSSHVVADPPNELKRVALAAARQAQLLESVGVELRTLVSAALGMLELWHDSRASHSEPPTPQEAEYSRAVTKSLDAIAHLVSNVLDYTRAESGRFELDQTAQFNVESLVDELLAIPPAMLALSGASNGESALKAIDVTYQIDPHVPPVLQGDGAVLGRILRRLVNNAVRFTQRGNVHIAVKSESKSKGRVKLTVRVSDTGVGMTAQQLRYLFAPFIAQRQRSTGGGNGLGLALCQRLAVLFPHGNLKLRSEKDVGTEVSFSAYFRISPSCNVVGTEDVPSLKDVEINVHIVSFKSSPLAVSLANVLARHGVNGNVHSCTEALLEELKASAFDKEEIVILDFTVPRDEEAHALLSAYDVMPMLPPIVRAIIIGHSFLRDIGQEQGNVQFVSKPVRLRSLLGTLKRRTGSELPSLAMPTTSTRDQARSPLRVLIAEDNALMRQTLCRIIEGLGAQCVATEHGKECVDVFAASTMPFDLVLMDLQMPVLDGYGAARIIREIEESRSGKMHTPIVALTATDIVSIGEHKGIDAVLSKPVTKKGLLDLFGRVASASQTELPSTPRTTQRSPSPTTPVVPTKSVRVLLVEDNTMIARITSKVLQRGGYAVEVAYEGQAALSCLERSYGTYDLILMDIIMPVMDGVTCTRKIRELEKQRGIAKPKPIVALSTNAQAAQRNACLTAGCSAFAAKPIDYPALHALLQSLLLTRLE